MDSRIFRSAPARALIVVYVLIAAGFVFLVQAQTAAAQGARTEIVIGLQNDMTDMNSWNPKTNAVWKAYQLGYDFEGLFANNPDYQVFPVLADPARTPQSGPGFYFNNSAGNTATQPVVDVYIRQGVTFHDGKLMNADDVVFTYQTLAWSTYQTFITEALWWDAPTWAHWSGGAAKSHIGIQKVDAYTVRFYLSKTYSLFFLGTLETTVIPKHIWVSHLNNATAPINITSLKPITDSADHSIDFSYGGSPTQAPATYGTGMFKFDSWTPNQGSRISVYDNYWGKSQGVVWRSVSYPFFPEHLRSIKFVIYTSLDVISLALQKGEIDTLIWSLTPGFLTQVRANPAISVEQVTDAGYFYLSFNLRRKPWNDLDLRKAISMAINKDYIVSTLMGGFGVKGDWPISIHTESYINTSASLPPFDLAGAATLLNSVGIIDRTGDGFRDFKDGSPIKATILTPPKDYDPVRADAGIMISNNLKAIGLNIDSAPTSFDTIVARAFGTPPDFDIYILGWLLTGTPETYLSDFFATKNDVAINPAGSNSAGYSNPEVDALLDQMSITLNDNARKQIVRDIEGIVDKEIPWNVLYYRKNLNAYRNDAWVGWVNTPPQLYNFWSLVKIRPAGLPVVTPPSGALSIGLNVPDHVFARQTVPIGVFVSQNNGPVSAASISVNISYGSTTTLLSGTTDATGKASFSWTVPVIQGNVLLTVKATSGTATGQNLKIMEVTIAPPLPSAQLDLSTTKPVIRPGGTTTITAKVTGGTGAALSGVAVTIDTTLLLGTVDAASKSTDSAGVATFTYSAPATAAKFPNAHLTDVMKANISVPNTVVGDTQKASIVLFVQNDAAPKWLIAAVQGTPSLVLRPAVPVTAIDVKVTDFAGTVVSGIDVDAIATDSNSSRKAEDNVTVSALTPGSNRTDGTGVAHFLVTETTAARTGSNSTNIVVRFQARNQVFAVSDSVALFLTDSLRTKKGYAAQLTVSQRTFGNSTSSQPGTVSAHVYDEAGSPVSGAYVVFQLFYGDLGLPAQFGWAYNYDGPEYLGEGLDLNFFGLGSLGGSFQNYSGQGPGYGVENWVEDLEVVGNFGSIDSCDPTTFPADFDGLYRINSTTTTDLSGTATASFATLPHKLDSGVQVRAYIGKQGIGVGIDACNFVSSIYNGLAGVSGLVDPDFRIDTGVVIQRQPVFALGSVTTSKPIFTSQVPRVTITAKFYAVDGAPAPSVKVFLVQGADRAARNVQGAFGGVVTASSTGTLSFARDLSRGGTKQATTVSVPSLTQALVFGLIPADPNWAYGGREQLFSGAFGDFWFAPTFAVLIAKIPFGFVRAYHFLPTTTAFLTATVSQTLIPERGNTTVTVTVYSVLTGAPVSGALVWTGFQTVTTDTSGQATFNTTASTSGATEQLIVAAAPYGGAARGWFSYIASPPILTYTNLQVTPGLAGSASKIAVTVQNTVSVGGTTTVWLIVDNVAVAAKQITIGPGASTTVTFDYVFDKAGSYGVTVGSQSQTVSIAAPPPPDVTALYALAGGLLVVGVVVGAVVGRMMARRGKKPPAMPAEEPKGGTSAEEELPPEEGL